jgi:hypothetical protein
MIGGEFIFPCTVVNLGKFVRYLEDHDWRRGHISLHYCQPREKKESLSGILRIRIGGEATFLFIICKEP